MLSQDHSISSKGNQLQHDPKADGKALAHVTLKGVMSSSVKANGFLRVKIPLPAPGLRG